MDTVFFIASKLVGLLIRVDTWVVLALALLVIALFMEWRRLAKVLAVGTFAVLLALSIMPLGDLLLRPLESAYAPAPPLDRVDGIIVLGGGEDAVASRFWGQAQVNEGGDRYLTALSLAQRFPRARILFAGGSGRLRDTAGGAVVTEADVAEEIFHAQGLARDRLLLESRSRNTAENARLSHALAQPAAGEVWVLVTSAFHMPRAMESFRAAGWEGLVAYPVDYRTSAFADGLEWEPAGHIETLNTAIKAWVGLIAYRLAGR
ncbi:MAG: hypothetical protein TEF_03755 [Rhizobiales bacterium NRL2]|jgi:uncharacterized SAM-binding protein YcdF (DUF218 family)|nr:MAG: hypothetical protein TEF_03755 [Rhizobiales bacterium NRL2]